MARRLIRPVDEARQLLDELIHQAQELANRSLINEMEYERAATERGEWWQHSVRLLRWLFSDNEIADEYWDKDGLWLMGTDDQPWTRLARDHRMHVTQLRERLVNIRERLPSYVPRVFIVHGHDEAARLSVMVLIQRLGFNPVVLQDRPAMGLTIIERIERESASAVYAVVVLTPDDVGAVRENASELQARARENVIFELGYFAALLGRSHVCLLRKGHVDFPSDLSGVTYVPMDEGAGWERKLADEMVSAGIAVDFSRLSRGD